MLCPIALEFNLSHPSYFLDLRKKCFVYMDLFHCCVPNCKFQSQSSSEGNLRMWLMHVSSTVRNQTSLWKCFLRDISEVHTELGKTWSACQSGIFIMLNTQGSEELKLYSACLVVPGVRIDKLQGRKANNRTTQLWRIWTTTNQHDKIIIGAQWWHAYLGSNQQLSNKTCWTRGQTCLVLDT